MRATFIVNPKSGRGKPARLWPAIHELFRAASWNFEVSFTERRGDAARLAGRAARDGCELIVAVGGDGTIHEVVNGLVAEGKAINPETAWGIIPCGTGNDLARVLGSQRDGWRTD